MSSLVLELQRDVLDANVTISALLLKAKVVATKLDLIDALEWIDSEFAGYKSYENVPAYRHVHVTIEAWNPYHGWQRVGFQDDDIREAFTNQVMTDSVSAIEDLLERVRDGGKIERAIEGDRLNFIHKQMPVKLHVASHLSPTALRHILGQVRERILTWALALEKRGVVGIGMSFSQDEKRQAESAPSIHIASITNMTGSIGGSINNQHIETSQVFVEDFKTRVGRFLEELDARLVELPDEDVGDVQSAARDVRAALEDPHQDENIIMKLLRKIPAASVSLSSYAMQAVITAEVGKLLGSAP